MLVLGFDTTASTVSAALLRDGKLIRQYSASSTTTHSTTLLPAIETLLQSASLKAENLDLICCSAGPGSFTGVRIGCATAKGLAAPFSIPCVGVSSLEAMAMVFGELPCVICPALNARRGNVYCALFVSDGKGCVSRITEDDLLSVPDLCAQISEKLSDDSLNGLPLYIVGDYINEITKEAEKSEINVSAAPSLLINPSGYGAALAGIREYKNSGCDRKLFTEARLTPIYLRKSQAEREKEERKQIK